MGLPFKVQKGQKKSIVQPLLLYNAKTLHGGVQLIVCCCVLGLAADAAPSMSCIAAMHIAVTAAFSGV